MHQGWIFLPLVWSEGGEVFCSEGAGSGAASCEANPMFGLLLSVVWYQVMSYQKWGHASKSPVPLPLNQTAF